MKNKIYGLLTLLLIIMTGFVIFNKTNSIKKDKELVSKLLTKHDSIQQKWINKVITYPDSLYNLKTQKSLNTSLSESAKEYLMISYIDADCSDCVNELKKWTKFLDSNSEFLEKVGVFFIATSSRKELFKYQVYDQAKLEYDIFFDKKNTFFELNNLSDIKSYQTFLLKGEKVIYVGSPIKDELFEKEILEIVEK